MSVRYGLLLALALVLEFETSQALGISLELSQKLEKDVSVANVHLSWTPCSCYNQDPVYKISIRYKNSTIIEHSLNTTTFVLLRQPYWKHMNAQLSCYCYGHLQLQKDRPLTTGPGALGPVQQVALLNETTLSWKPNQMDLRTADWYFVRMTLNNTPHSSWVEHQANTDGVQMMQIPAVSADAVVRVTIFAVIRIHSSKEFISLPTDAVLELWQNSGKVRDLVAKQSNPRVASVTVSWKEPEFLGKRHVGFAVTLVYPSGSLKQTYTDALTIELAVPGGAHNSTFQILVATADKTADNGIVVGSHVLTSFTLSTIPSPRIVVVERTPTSLSCEIESTETVNVYYKVNGRRVNESKFKLNGLKPYAEYVVRAQVCFVDGACGDEATAVIRTDATVPTEVSYLNLRPMYRQRLVATWKPPKVPNGPIDGYLVELRSTDGIIVVSAQTDGETHFYRFDQIPEEATYTFHIRAFNLDSKNMKRKHIGPRTQMDVLVPNMGSVVDASIPYRIETDVGPTWASVSWLTRKQANASGFRVTAVPVFHNASKDHEGGHEVHYKPSIVFGARSPLTLTGLQAVTTYVGTVQTCTKTETKEWPAICGEPGEFKFTTTIDVPSAPRNVTCSVNADTITVTWNPPEYVNGPELEGYQIIIYKMPSRQIATRRVVTATVHGSSFNQLESGATYRVEVSALSKDETRRFLQSVSEFVEVSTAAKASVSTIALLVVVAVAIGAAAVGGLGFILRRR